LRETNREKEREREEREEREREREMQWSAAGLYTRSCAYIIYRSLRVLTAAIRLLGFIH